MRRCCWILIETHANLALVQQRNATSGLYLARYPLALSRKRALDSGVYWVLCCLDYRPESSPAGRVQHLHSRALGFEGEHPFLARPHRGNACTPLRTTAGSARQDRSPSLSTQESQKFGGLTLPGHDRPSSPARCGHLIIRVPELLAK